MAPRKMPFVSLREAQIDMISCYVFKTKQLCVCVCVCVCETITINISTAVSTNVLHKNTCFSNDQTQQGQTSMSIRLALEKDCVYKNHKQQQQDN